MRVHASNNIIAGTKQPLAVSSSKPGVSISVSGNNNWMQTGAQTAGLRGSIFGAHPGFADPDRFNFRLSLASCIGAAAQTTGNSSLLPTAEYYKDELTTQECRARVSARDLGAFEHTTAGPSSNKSCGQTNVLCFLKTLVKQPWIQHASTHR
jgi:hypothetical protein